MNPKARALWPAFFLAMLFALHRATNVALAARVSCNDGHSGALPYFRSLAFRRSRRGAGHRACDCAGRLFVRSRIVVVRSRKGSRAEGGAHRRSQHGRRPWSRHARPGAGEIRKNRRGTGRIRQGDHHRSASRRGAVQPRPALSARKAASARDRRLHNGERPDAAAGRTVAGARDQLSGDGQVQGSRRRPRRGGAGRPAKCPGLDDAGTGL